MKRTFIATKINPGKTFLDTYTNLRNELDKEKIKWVDHTNFHLTLFFLGDTTDEQVQQVSSGLKNILSSFDPFSIQLQGLGVFKNFFKPRVLWAGILGFDRLKAMKMDIDEAMVDVGFSPEEREFRPHLTLGRIKWLNDKDKLKDLVLEYQNYFFQDIVIDEIIYYESILKPQGPAYIQIEKYKLGE